MPETTVRQDQIYSVRAVHGILVAIMGVETAHWVMPTASAVLPSLPSEILLVLSGIIGACLVLIIIGILYDAYARNTLWWLEDTIESIPSPVYDDK